MEGRKRVARDESGSSSGGGVEEGGTVVKWEK